MKKPKSFNFSLFALTSIFVLSQTVFALSATMSGTKAEGNNNLLSQNNSYEYITYDERAKILTPEQLTALASSQTMIALQAPTETVLSNEQPTLLSASDQVVTLAASAPEPKQEIKGVVRYVNANSLNVRKEANSASGLVTTIKRGDKVTYYETIGEWARIITWTDKKGYILAKYLVNSEKDVEKVAVEKKPEVSRSTASTTDNNAGAEPASSEALSLTDKIIAYAKSLQGVKYVYGGYSTKGFDCSGFTKYVFAKYGLSLPRSSSDYLGAGTKVSRANLRAGDIVLWDIDGGSADVGHVGIYLGDGTFIHASSSKGKVVIANLATYREKYMGARRFIK